VLQIGTPTDLFERPAHSFVGYFIGSPGMNFLPVSVAGTHAVVDNIAFDLGAHYRTPAAGTAVQLGFRPDYATVRPQGGIPVRVLKIEDLGRRRLVRVALGGHEAVAVLPNDVSLSPGDSAGLHVTSQHLHIYVDEHRVEGLSS
jgi:glycerol transport system ATP-binding protein